MDKLMDKFTIEHLNLHYGDFHALKDINLNIGQKEITAFICALQAAENPHY